MQLKNRLITEQEEEKFTRAMQQHFADENNQIKEPPKKETSYSTPTPIIVISLFIVGAFALSKYNNKTGYNNPFFVI